MKFLTFKRNEQFAKFMIVGSTNFLVSFTVFNFCYMHLKLGSGIFYTFNAMSAGIMDRVTSGNAASDITFDAALANIIGYACGVLNSFIWNRVWTFKAKYKAAKQFYYFIILNIFCLLLSTGIITVFVDIWGAPHKAVWLYTMFFVTFINYIVCKNWVFNKNTYRK